MRPRAYARFRNSTRCGERCADRGASQEKETRQENTQDLYQGVSWQKPSSATRNIQTPFKKLLKRPPQTSISRPQSRSLGSSISTGTARISIHAIEDIKSSYRGLPACKIQHAAVADSQAKSDLPSVGRDLRRSSQAQLMTYTLKSPRKPVSTGTPARWPLIL
jgi:hypothetical protein